MTLAAAAPPVLKGVQTPRIAPPQPERSKLAEMKREAKGVGIKFIPAQEIAATYLTALGANGWLYREVAIIEARRNGKTELLVPRIRMDLHAGRVVLHTAQNRTLPRRVFMRVAQSLDPAEVRSIRYANGQEQIIMRNGGEYSIVAPKRGARGLGADTLIFDELREYEDDDVVAAAAPTIASSAQWGQIIYLSNAGSDRSVVLNNLKRRGEEAADPRLAYLEWSPSPDRSADDRAGWAEANPALGHFLTLEALEAAYNTLQLATFETEHLCRWVASMQPRLVGDAAWMRCRADLEATPTRPAIAFNMDPSGRRASAVMAWTQTDGRIAVTELLEGSGDPIDLPALGADIQALVTSNRAKRVAFASWTDQDLARHVRRAQALDGKEFAQASEAFARYVLEGRVAWDNAAHITDDLTWAARKPHDSGAWQAVPANPDRSITAINAAIRAVWLASAPRSMPRIG